MKKILHLVQIALIFMCGLDMNAQTSNPLNSNVVKFVNEYQCPYDISDNKEHVVIQGYSESSSYYWSEATGIVPMAGYAFSVSNDGVVAGWYTDESGYNVAGRWYPESEKWEFLGMNPDVPEFTDMEYNSAWTMSHDGEKIGVMQFDASWNTFAYVWSEEKGYEQISSGGYSMMRPNGMDDDGSVVAGYYVNDIGARAPCYWLDGEFFEISTISGEAMNVSPDGNYVCGTFKDTEGNGFIYNIKDEELIIIENTIAPGTSMMIMCVTNEGYAYGYVNTGGPTALNMRKGIAYVEEELMLFEDYLLVNGVNDAESWNVYTVNDVTPDGKTFIGAANMKGVDYTFMVTIEDAVCDSPSNLTYTVDENDYNTITLNWDAPADPVGVTYEIYPSYTSIDPLYTGITETSFTIENLDAGYYSFLVRANWNGECLSNTSNAVNVKIDPCDPRDMCEITIKMLDGYGDGWNGAHINIVGNNNNFPYEVGLKNEGLDTVVVNLPLCPDTYKFTWNFGEYDEEIFFSISFDGNELFRADYGDIDYKFEHLFLEYELSCDNETSLHENLSSALEVCPNPVNDKLIMMTKENIKEIDIYTLTGVCVYKVTDSNKIIDVSQLDRGVYFIKVRTENEEMIKPFVKN